MTMHKVTLTTLAVLAATGCSLSASNGGVAGTPANTHPDVPGTVVTILFENEAVSDVIKPQNAYFWQLAQTNAVADAYISSTHPSLPNYIEMTSGSTQGIGNDNDPTDPKNQIAGTDNLADQLDAAGVKWRAYGESMGTACNMTSTKLYAAHHMPWLYYQTMSTDAARCADRVVDFDQSFASDLATGQLRYMFVTPNMCHDMHDCGADVVQPWLENVVNEIQASPGYQNGGAIFLMFDEGSVRILGASADLPTIVLSPKLVSPTYHSQTTFGHPGYLATMEDILDLPRLPTTMNAVPMDELFVPKAVTP